MELNAAYRLNASMAIKMGENYSEKEFNGDVKTVTEALKSHKPSKLGTKGGLTLFVLRNVAAFNKKQSFIYFATKDGEVTGLMKISPTTVIQAGSHQKPVTVHAVFIRSDYRGKGLGIVLYLAAIKTFKAISSAYNGAIGVMALKTWEKLGRYYTVSLYCGNIKKFIKFDWVGSVPMAHTTKGLKSVTKLQGMFLLYASEKEKP